MNESTTEDRTMKLDSVTDHVANALLLLDNASNADVTAAMRRGVIRFDGCPQIVPTEIGHDLLAQAQHVAEWMKVSDAQAFKDLATRSEDPKDPNNGGDRWIGFGDAACERWRRLRTLKIVEHAPVRHFGECGRAWWRPTPAGRLVASFIHLQEPPAPELPERLALTISCVEGRLTGSPCIDGTRVPVATLLSMLRQGTSVEKLAALYPELETGALTVLGRIAQAMRSMQS